MTYSLGVDIGNSVTAASVWRDGQLSTVPLGTASEVVPTAIFVLPDGGMLVGDAALERGTVEPDRLSTAFIGRLADPVPQQLGTESIAQTELTGQLLRFVLAKVTAREGGPPSHVTLIVPARWGGYHRELMTRVAAQAGLTDVGLLASPIAVAIHHAAQSRLEVGAAVAIFDLGGATLATAVVRRTETGYDLLGQPGVDESIGGNVFDDVVMKHVRRSLGNAYDLLDRSDPAVRAQMVQLRADAVAAKEALSTEVDTTITARLPDLVREIRYTRGEFEGAVRIPLLNAVGALERTIESAGLTPEQVQAVLLAGGSSQIPLVSQLLAGELGMDVVTDAHPRFAAGLGAAMSSASRAEEAARVAAPSPVAVAPPELPPMDTADLLAPPAVLLTATPAESGVAQPADQPVRAAPGIRPSLRALSGRTELVAEYAGNRRRGLRALLLALVAVAVVVGAVVFLATRGSEPGPGTGPVDGTTTGTSSVDTSTTPTVQAGAPLTATALPLPAVPGESAQGVAATGTGLVAVGGTADPVAPRGWLSDGQTWTVAGTPGLLATDRVWTLTAVTAGPGLPLIATGWSAATDATDPPQRRGEVWVSADGQVWVPATVPEVGEMTAVVRTSGGYLAAAQSYATDDTDGDAVMLSSADGATWTVLAAGGLDGPGPFRMSGIAVDPAGGLVAVGSRLDGAAQRSGLWRSADGAVWTFDSWLPAVDFGIADARGITVDAAGALLVVGAQSGPSGGPMVWRSEGDQLVPHPVQVAGADSAAVTLTGVVAAPAGLVLVGAVAGVGAAAWSVA